MHVYFVLFTKSPPNFLFVCHQIRIEMFLIFQKGGGGTLVSYPTVYVTEENLLVPQIKTLGPLPIKKIPPSIRP